MSIEIHSNLPLLLSLSLYLSLYISISIGKCFCTIHIYIYIGKVQTRSFAGWLLIMIMILVRLSILFSDPEIDRRSSPWISKNISRLWRFFLHLTFSEHRFLAIGETRLVSWQGNLNGVAAMTVSDPLCQTPDLQIWASNQSKNGKM